MFMFWDGVVAEGYFPNPKFDLSGFDLYAGLEAIPMRFTSYCGTSFQEQIEVTY